MEIRLSEETKVVIHDFHNQPMTDNVISDPLRFVWLTENNAYANCGTPVSYFANATLSCFQETNMQQFLALYILNLQSWS